MMHDKIIVSDLSEGKTDKGKLTLGETKFLMISKNEIYNILIN